MSSAVQVYGLLMNKTENEIVGGEPDEGETPTVRNERTYER